MTESQEVTPPPVKSIDKAVIRFDYLLALLVTMFVVEPLLPDWGKLNTILANLGMQITLLIAGSFVARFPGSVLLLRLGSLSVFALLTIGVLMNSMWMLILGQVLYIVFFIAVLYGVLRVIAAPGPVDSNKLLGTVSAYLIAGLAWTLVYTLTETLHPGSFNNLGESSETSGQLMYFSLVTLSTLGYGDITPATPFTRIAASLQAIAGQFYIAIVVAWLVGTITSQRSSDD